MLRLCFLCVVHLVLTHHRPPCARRHFVTVLRRVCATSTSSMNVQDSLFKPALSSRCQRCQTYETNYTSYS
ncbi:uncharacterized protein C8Q71DRAFT_767487 [Rhodofomes roseus]|uniref:Secreted protein n=1 Tax=Rhodofomes roseus TaxID=34475 RepID=A0ABQ8KD12_9APHY|nr:uncharacterized protein C8Q71DRAFT_767487 [Rhodofomes roseus]KAH9834926.1 hypothetical protein C8Q71DRAFT_767487 [Rhodofomes roseus]